MDNKALNRVIALVDMDCFYCQVEAREDPSLKNVPVAVVQYNQWKQGGIVAVSYEARARGVTRFMRGEEAVKQCPELQLRSIPCVRGKADLTKFRDAGAEVAAVFCEFSSCVQRASIDEAFIDLTQVVEERITSGNVHLTPENMSSTYVIGNCDLETKSKEARLKGIVRWIEKLRENPDILNSEYRLAVGALIIEEMRALVLQKTGFTCSAGIAHNKILAKVVAGLHKPSCQTVLPHDSVLELYETLPVAKVRTLGGKFGKAVAQKLNIKNMSELYNISKKQLQDLFDEKQGAWLYDIARGIDYDPVTTRLIAESIGCSKNFRGKMALGTVSAVEHWVRQMADELAERLGKDAAENKRRARLLTVSFRLLKDTLSRSCPLTSYQASGIANDALDLLKKFNRAPLTTNAWEPPIEGLGLSASKFISEQSSTIKSFFKPGTSTQLAEDHLKTQVKCDRSVEIGTELNALKRTPIRIEKFMRASTKEESESENKAIDTNKVEPKFAALPTSDNLSKSDKSTKTALPPSGSFFAKLIAQKSIEPEPPEREASSCLPITEEEEEDDLCETCPECSQRIHLSVYLEHLDYHTALQLQKSLNGSVAVKTVAARSENKSGSPVKKRRKLVKAKDQHAITNYFSTCSSSTSS